MNFFAMRRETRWPDEFQANENKNNLTLESSEDNQRERKY